MASCVHMTAVDGIDADVLSRRKVSLERTGLTVSIQTLHVHSAALNSGLESSWASLMNEAH